MGGRRPWQVLFRPDRRSQIRSRSFSEEQTAVSWAQAYVRESGGEAFAHVGFKEAPDGSSPSAVTMPSHMTWLRDGEVVVKSWAGRTEAEAWQATRDALEGRPNSHGPTLSYGVDRPLHVISGGRTDRLGPASVSDELRDNRR